jgi:hypothetical protein
MNEQKGFAGEQTNIMRKQTNIAETQAAIAKSLADLEHSKFQLQVEPFIHFGVARREAGGGIAMARHELAVRNLGVYAVAEVNLAPEEFWVSRPPYEQLDPGAWNPREPALWRRHMPLLAPSHHGVPENDLTINLGPLFEDVLRMLPDIQEESYGLVCFRLTYLRTADRRSYTHRLRVFTLGRSWQVTRPGGISHAYIPILGIDHLSQNPQRQALVDKARQVCSPEREPAPEPRAK